VKHSVPVMDQRQIDNMFATRRAGFRVSSPMRVPPRSKAYGDSGA
jgi:hypothetical protein